MTGLTYPQFHFAFLVPAVLALVAVTTVSRRHAAVRTVWPRGVTTAYWVDVGLLVVVAVVYTTPWDNYLIAQGVWAYGPGRVLARLGYTPLSEYAFFAVQPVLTALWLAQLPLPRDWPVARGRRRYVVRAAGVVLAGALFVVGWWCLGTDSTFYLGAILTWAAPVLALQWAVGAPQLWRHRRTVALGVAVPTTYLSVVDRAAIDQGVWVLSHEYTTGVTLAGLPVEEATFFLVTNLFVVQGLILARFLRDR